MRKIREFGKRAAALLMIVSLAAGGSAGTVRAAEGASGGTVPIRSEEEFVLLAESCRTETFSTEKIFKLEADLDLSEYENLFVPVMDGTFDGNGHKITGLFMTEEMSDYGLFRYIGIHGTVKNLTVEGEVLGGEDQEHIGILAGSNAGTILNCVSQGKLNGQTAAGGIAGKNEESGTISRCTNEAEVDGKWMTGGIAGQNDGTITDCVNSGKVNTNQKVKKQAEGDGNSVNISIPNAVTGLAADERANETGGIAGRSSGTVSYCTNTATIGFERLGSAAGGIIGRQQGSLSYSSNKGVVYGHKNIGGAVGVLEPYEESSYNRDYREELSDELDRLGDLVEELADHGEQLGDHLSDNVDILSDQLKALRNSIRGYTDDYGEMLEDGADSIHDNVKKMKKTIDGMQYEVDTKELNEALEQISKDIAQMEQILEQLKPYLEQGNDALDALIQQYEQKIKDWINSLETLEAYEASLPAELPEDDFVPEQLPDSEPTESDEEEEIESEPTESDEEQPAEPAPAETGEKEETLAPTAPEEEEETSESEQKVQEEASAGRMTLVSYRVVTSAPMPSGTETGGTEPGGAGSGTATIPPELTAALQQLLALSQDVAVQMNRITVVLGKLPGQTDQLLKDVKSIGGNIGSMADDIDDILDDFEDEMDTMKGDLRGKGNRISDTLDQTSDAFHADWDQMTDTLDQIDDQFDRIRGTISDALDELKSRMEDHSIYVDVSELTDAVQGDGKIVSCSNFGEVYADTQGGGIVGGIVKDTAQKAAGLFFLDDTEDDREEEKDRITRHVLAAVFASRNTADVTVKGDYAGGIAGRADYGVIAQSENYGDILADEGMYAGGIAGFSSNLIRDSYVLSGVSGDGYIGGIAGRAEDVTGNWVCAYLDVDRYVKASGAVVGKADGTVKENRFVDHGYGAVDGVTRSAEAEAMDYESMIAEGSMPSGFTQFTIRFMNEDQVVWQQTYAYGEELSEKDYPELPKSKEGYVYWENKDLSPIHRNVTVHAVCRAYLPALASEAEDGKAALLIGGEFYPDTTISVREATEEELAQIKEKAASSSPFYKYYVKQAYGYEISQAEALREQAVVRVYSDSRLADSIMTMDAAYEAVGAVQEADSIGSYLSADTTISSTGYVVVLNRVDTWIEVLASLLAVALGIGTVTWLHVQRKKRKEAENRQENEKS